MEPEVEKSDSEASGEEEPEGGENTDKCLQEAKVRPWSFNIHVLLAIPCGRSPAFIYLFGVFLQEQESESIKLKDLLEKEARAFYFGDRSQMGRPGRHRPAGP